VPISQFSPPATTQAMSLQAMPPFSPFVPRRIPPQVSPSQHLAIPYGLPLGHPFAGGYIASPPTFQAQADTTKKAREARMDKKRRKENKAQAVPHMKSQFDPIQQQLTVTHLSPNVVRPNE